MIQKLFTILILLTISGCSLLGTKQIEVVSKPVQIDIMQPDLPRPVELTAPRWYVVSEAKIANPCKKVDDKRPKVCDLEDRENPDWPEGYTYLDRFMDDIKKANAFITQNKGYQKMSQLIFEDMFKYFYSQDKKGVNDRILKFIGLDGADDVYLAVGKVGKAKRTLSSRTSKKFGELFFNK